MYQFSLGSSTLLTRHPSASSNMSDSVVRTVWLPNLLSSIAAAHTRNRAQSTTLARDSTSATCRSHSLSYVTVTGCPPETYAEKFRHRWVDVPDQ